MSNPDGVLEAIDACLRDSLSPDAMRWAPDEPDPTPEDNPFARLAEWVEQHAEGGCELTDWQRRMLLHPTEQPAFAPSAVSWSGGGWPIIRDEPGDTLEWETTVTPAGEVIASAVAPTSGMLLLIRPREDAVSTWEERMSQRAKAREAERTARELAVLVAEGQGTVT